MNIQKYWTQNPLSPLRYLSRRKGFGSQYELNAVLNTPTFKTSFLWKTCFNKIKLKPPIEDYNQAISINLAEAPIFFIVFYMSYVFLPFGKTLMKWETDQSSGKLQ
jgi:hypothetical protein